MDSYQTELRVILSTHMVADWLWYNVDRAVILKDNQAGYKPRKATSRRRVCKYWQKWCKWCCWSTILISLSNPFPRFLTCIWPIGRKAGIVTMETLQQSMLPFLAVFSQRTLVKTYKWAFKLKKLIRLTQASPTPSNHDRYCDSILCLHIMAWYYGSILWPNTTTRYYGSILWIALSRLDTMARYYGLLYLDSILYMRGSLEFFYGPSFIHVRRSLMFSCDEEFVHIIVHHWMTFFPHVSSQGFLQGSYRHFQIKTWRDIWNWL